jgi:1-acyl-sn-glycerol-3-phosphate acyltransferase
MYISVEGKRSLDGRRGRFYHGTAALALASKATIVPIVLTGAREVLPVGAVRPRPGHIHAVLCPAFTPDMARELWARAAEPVSATATVAAVDATATAEAVDLANARGDPAASRRVQIAAITRWLEDVAHVELGPP